MADLFFAEHHFIARADRTLWHPASGRLLLSDLHLGKGAIFRHAGIPIPAASENADLDRLQQAVTTSGATALWILGDLFHAPRQITAAQCTQWKMRFAALDIELWVILGNHDRFGADIAEALGFQIAPEPTAFGGCDLAHHPDSDASRPRIAGHIHPQVLLKQATDQLVYPCFAVLNQQTLLLPAFTNFSGGPRFRPQDANCYAITPLGVLPPHKLAPR